MLRNFLALFSCLIFLTVTGTVSAASLQLDAPIGVLIDAESGAVLFDRKAHERINPGELTCLMTLYTALKLSEEKAKEASFSYLWDLSVCACDERTARRQ